MSESRLYYVDVTASLGKDESLKVVARHGYYVMAETEDRAEKEGKRLLEADLGANIRISARSEPVEIHQA